MWEKIKEFIAVALTLLIACLAGGICIAAIMMGVQVVAALFNLG